MLRSCFSFMIAVLLVVLFQEGAGAQGPGGQRPNVVPNKRHSQLFERYGVKGRKLPDLTGSEDISILTIADLRDPSRASSPVEYLGRAHCDADLVVIGTIVDGTSSLTEDAGFIFSDHIFRIESILKNNRNRAAEQDGEVTVTRPGGTLKLGGRMVHAEVEGFASFRQNTKYLLYLKFVATTQSYQAFGEGSFELREKAFHKLTRELLWNERLFPSKDTPYFVDQARQAANTVCK